MAARNIIDNGLIELRYGQSTVGNDLTEFDLLKIAPFNENNGLAKLRKSASLQFTELDTMPRLDGATAAYEVGGENKRILPYQRPDNSGSQTVMQGCKYPKVLFLVSLLLVKFAFFYFCFTNRVKLLTI